MWPLLPLAILAQSHQHFTPSTLSNSSLGSLPSSLPSLPPLRPCSLACQITSDQAPTSASSLGPSRLTWILTFKPGGTRTTQFPCWNLAFGRCAAALDVQIQSHVLIANQTIWTWLPARALPCTYSKHLAFSTKSYAEMRKLSNSHFVFDIRLLKAATWLAQISAGIWSPVKRLAQISVWNVAHLHSSFPCLCPGLVPCD